MHGLLYIEFLKKDIDQNETYLSGFNKINEESRMHSMNNSSSILHFFKSVTFSLRYLISHSDHF